MQSISVQGNHGDFLHTKLKILLCPENFSNFLGFKVMIPHRSQEKQRRTQPPQGAGHHNK
ncbi:hypothetical protein COV18_06345 [Candidatus Woesearchaeota archaeon CG10_big_fil_rev_8_21_14_0_10_37_12]|nr:MAG: hypothetical protein COV18_06345 [Candidatus Woesearchaeota archaeon CG10_big_fil_rev_8_21_14_0_10_37_12]